MKHSIRAVLITAMVIAVVVMCRQPGGEPPRAERDDGGGVVAALTAGDGSRFAAVEPGVPLRFPADHGAHPEFRQEWWYFTGNLADESGRRFGFQLTFFRFAHDAFSEYRASRWRHQQSWMAHFAVSDIDERRIIAAQDYARGALDLAGARAAPFAVWVNGWSARGVDPGEDGFRAILTAESDQAQIVLEVGTGEAPLLQGDAGYSIKDRAGNTASYYYSFPNLSARGTLVLDGRSFTLEGRAWMDREWSTAVLAKGQAGWDWFAVRLATGATLMVFQVRGERGEPFRHAVLVDDGGRVRRFDSDAVRLVPLRWWTSGATGARYPLAWRLEIDAAGIGLEVTAAFEAQELDLDFRYWEGVVDVAGSVDNEPVRGEGYMELTGYPGRRRAL